MIFIEREIIGCDFSDGFEWNRNVSHGLSHELPGIFFGGVSGGNAIERERERGFFLKEKWLTTWLYST